jgi:alanyl-tRNA synthetase
MFEGQAGRQEGRSSDGASRGWTAARWPHPHPVQRAELSQSSARDALRPQGGDLASSAVDVAGIKVVATRVDGADAPALRDAVDRLKSKLRSAAIVLASVQEPDKVVLIAGVTQDQLGKLKAGELVNVVAQMVGGRGGGRPDMAQAGGNDPAKLDEALAAVAPWVESRLLSQTT